MPRPDKVTAFLTRDVVIDGWHSLFGVYSRFCVPKFRQIMIDDCKINRVKDVYSYIVPAQRSIDASWNEEYNIRTNDDYAQNQINRLHSLDVVPFFKAVVGIVCLELAAQERGCDIFKTSGHQLIEPVVYYIHGLNEDFLNKAIEKNPKIMDELKTRCNQSNPKVFWDMCEGKTVTFETAEGVLEILKPHDSKNELQNVDFVQRFGVKRQSASKNEDRSFLTRK